MAVTAEQSRPEIQYPDGRPSARHGSGHAGRAPTGMLSYEQRVRQEAGRRLVRSGATIGFAGLAITTFSFLSASPGQSYVLTWGAVLYGAIQFFRGLVQMSD